MRVIQVVLWPQMGYAAGTAAPRRYLGGTLAATGYVVPILLYEKSMAGYETSIEQYTA